MGSRILLQIVELGKSGRRATGRAAALRCGLLSTLVVGLGLWLGGALLQPVAPVRAAPVDYCAAVTLRTDSPPQCYDANHRGQCIAWEFTDYWERNGGLDVFGYPITGIACEYNQASGNKYYTQWFERRRLEIHPELPSRYYISEGLLGVERLRAIERPALLGNPVHPSFTSYWGSHGLDFGDPGYSPAESTALFGVTMSAPEYEPNGDWSGLSQWFERARFEWHTELRTPGVLLGLLGNETNATNAGAMREEINSRIRGGPNAAGVPAVLAPAPAASLALARLRAAPPLQGIAPPLQINTELDRAAQYHANYLMLNLQDPQTRSNPSAEIPGRPGFTGETVQDRVQAAQYTGGAVDEVVAFFGNPQKAVTNWLAIPSARATLANPQYILMGYGYGQVVVDPVTGEGIDGVDVVVVGASAQTSQPTVTPSPPPPPISTATTATPTPCVPQQVFAEGFETGMGAFTAGSAGPTPGPGQGWGVSTNGGAGWTAHSGIAMAFAPDSVVGIKDRRLTTSSPINIPVGAASATLSFWHRYDLAISGYPYSVPNAGVLETSTDGGATWQDVSATTTFLAGGYNGTTGPNGVLAGHPFGANRQSWTNSNGGGYTEVRVNVLPFAGQPFRFRFRLGSTDNNPFPNPQVGWQIDDITVTVASCLPPPIPTP